MPTIMNDLLNVIRTIGLNTIKHATLYTCRKPWIEAQWDEEGNPRRGTALWHAFRERLQNPMPTWPQAWYVPGPVEHIQSTERGAKLETTRAAVDIALFAPDIARVRVFPRGGARPPVPYAIAKPENEWPIPKMTSLQVNSAFALQTEAMTLGVLLDNAGVFVADPDDHLLRVDLDVSWSTNGALRHRTILAPEEHIFGLGERARPWNRRGRTHILWNTEPTGYANADDPINLNIPVYIGAHSAGHYLVFYENLHYAEFDLGESLPPVADHRFENGELRYYIIVGDIPHLLTRYTELTGRHTLPPLWMLGYHQSRWSYYPDTRVRKLARDFHDYDVPCDAIHLDIHYMDDYRVFSVDKTKFPDLPQLASDLREQGLKLISIIDPGVKKDPHYAVYNSGLEGHHFCTLPDGDTVIHAPVWPGPSAFPDFTHPATRAWWGEQYAPLVEAGIAGFWNDMNEPAAFTGAGDHTLPNPTRHHLEGREGNHREAHNVYGMQMARASQEGLLRLRPNKRPVIITRAGWAGVQRYATSWTGDNESTWDALRLTTPMVMGLGLSGLGFTGPDTGGFVGEADGELFTRWIQITAFMPFFRAHTMDNTPDQAPWSYGEPYLSIVRRFIQLRYELLPYLYTATFQMSAHGWPMVRPLWWRESQNADLWDVDDAFLCGDALLVAPVSEPDTNTRDVPLPTGTWYDFWSNEVYEGAGTLEQYIAPLEIVPLFVRAGTVLTMGEPGPNVEQRNQKFLRLSVYPLIAPGEATSLLYEDAGEGFAYQEGEYQLSRFILRRTAEKLDLTWERKGNYTPPYIHIELTLNGLQRAPRQILADGEAYPIIQTDPVRHTVLLGVPIFDKLEVTL